MREAKTCPHCGCEISKARSPRHHRFYFKAISSAFHHWPEKSEFAPQNEEHLRHWLQVSAGHCVNLDGFPGDPEFVRNCLAMALQTGSSGFITVLPTGKMRASFPKSIEWAKVSQDEFAPIADAVFEIIETITGFPVHQLISETEAAA